MFDFSQFPVLETERLILRQMIPSDAESVFAFRSDPEVTKYFGAAFTELSQADALIQKHSERFVDKIGVIWGISLKPDTKIIGSILLFHYNANDRRATLGYELHRQYWRKGIISEGLKPVLEFAYTQLDLNRIQADVVRENSASSNLLINMGFVQEGIQREIYFERDAFQDLVNYSLLQREWLNTSQ